jgi:hypothetical protein
MVEGVYQRLVDIGIVFVLGPSVEVEITHHHHSERAPHDFGLQVS